MWHFLLGPLDRAGHLFNDRSGCRLRVDGWTFFRLLIYLTMNKRMLRAPLLIRYADAGSASSSFSQKKKKKKWNFLFSYYFLPGTASNMNEGGNFVICVTGGFLLFLFFFFFIILSKYTEKKGRRVFRFSTVHRTGWVCVMVEWVVNCTALGHYRTSGSVLHPSTDARLYAVWCFWSAERTPLLFFSSSSSFYLLELLPAPPLCAEWVVNTWYVCDRLFFFFLSISL